MSNETRNYLVDFNYRAYTHTMSASQLDTFLSCPRKWWFEKVARMPQLEGQIKFEFGDRLHEACERWLRADDTGRNEDGSELDLWPDGWDEGLSAADAALVRRLVEAGIEQGVLRRTPQRRVEEPVAYPGPKPQTPRMIVPGVGICGYRDLSAPGLVEDHKSIKSRTYMKSQKAIREDPQMMLYGAIDLIEGAEAGERRPHVTLRQNQFIKDPNDLYVRPCEVDVPTEEVEAFWAEHIEPAAREMLRYKKGSKKADNWEQVEGPRKKGACQNYGGCQFARICGKAETPAGYRARIQRANNMPTEEQLTINDPTAKEHTMGVFDKLNAKPAAQPAADAPAAVADPNPTVEQYEQYEEVDGDQAPVELSDTPPWANADCSACEGSGFNKKGKPCAACDRVAERDGAPRASSFELDSDAEGYVTWTRIADEVLIGRRLLAVAEVAAGDATKTPKPNKARKSRKSKLAEVKPETTAEPDSPAPAAVSAQPAGVEPGADKTRGKGRKGRPATGFLIVYGAVRRAKMELLDLNEVFHRYAAELAAAQGVDSFYLLDRFKRRDMMASKAAEIAKTIGSATLVVVRADDPDIRSFATALEPFATNIIEGVA